MRKILLFLALAAGVVNTYAGAKIEWKNTTHNFGAFNESLGAATADFTFYNTGDEPLAILGARANCGCTKPTYTAEVVMPGDSAVLSVTYDPEGRPGRFDKRVYVDTNTEPSRSTLIITGVSIGSPSTLASRYPVEAGPLRLSHPGVLLGNIKKGQVKSIFESAYNASSDTLRPVVVSSPDWLVVSPVPEVVPPGEQLSFSYLVRSEKINSWDLVTDTVTVRPDRMSSQILKIPVVITVTEDFDRLSDKDRINAPVVSLDSQRLDPLTLDPEKGAIANVVITNRGKNPLKLHRLYTLTPGVTTDLRPEETLKAGKSRNVKVTVSPSVLGKSKAMALIFNLITNDPVTPKTSITIPVRSTEN